MSGPVQGRSECNCEIIPPNHSFGTKGQLRPKGDDEGVGGIVGGREAHMLSNSPSETEHTWIF